MTIQSNCEWQRLNAKWERENTSNGPMRAATTPNIQHVCHTCKTWGTDRIHVENRLYCISHLPKQ